MMRTSTEDSLFVLSMTPGRYILSRLCKCPCDTRTKEETELITDDCLRNRPITDGMPQRPSHHSRTVHQASPLCATQRRAYYADRYAGEDEVRKWCPWTVPVIGCKPFLAVVIIATIQLQWWTCWNRLLFRLRSYDVVQLFFNPCFFDRPNRRHIH